MAFTTATVTDVNQSKQQFQGIFNEMWTANVVANPDSIAAAGESTGTYTIPGVALGDMVIGYSAGVDLTADAQVQVYVSAANTVVIRISNLHASSALDLGSSTWKILVGRPNW